MVVGYYWFTGNSNLHYEYHRDECPDDEDHCHEHHTVEAGLVGVVLETLALADEIRPVGVGSDLH